MARIETYCGDCCFYNNFEKKCQHNILDIFEKDGSSITWGDSGPYVDRVCQYKRVDEWVEKNNINSVKEKIELCKREIYLKGTIIILANSLESFQSTMDKLIKIENIKNFKIIIIFKNLLYSDILRICGNTNLEYKIIHNINSDVEYQIYKALEFCRNGYLFILDSLKEFDEKIIDKINNAVNIKMLRLLHVTGSDGIHESVSMIHLYKWLKGDLQCSFEMKLKDISEQEKSNAKVFTWKEINEQYSH